MSDVTRILKSIEEGDPKAAEDLLPLVYDELRKVAAARLAREKPGQTLSATSLVHEAYIRLVDVQNTQGWNSRGHFFGAAAEAMRRILVEQARRKSRMKRGGHLQRLELDDCDLAIDIAPERLLAIDEALSRLKEDDSLAARLVTLRQFAGLSVEDAGELLGVSTATAYRHWNYGRAWLQCELFADSEDSAN